MPSAHRVHLSTISLIRLAEKTLEYINHLDERIELTSKEKVEMLMDF